ncbi:MAG: hypothetical protein AB8B91_02665 [Rubripirellula sp.]
MALLLLPVGAAFGWLHGDTPRLTWLTTILLIDVAHVYATGFRVYFDVSELRRRPWLYGLTPLLAFVVLAAIYSEGELLFWSVLAYLAVFHFVRQQYGWVALYRTREGDTDTRGRWIDTAAIYLATIYPLVHWHSHLPRNFWWFAEGDFVRLPTLVADALEPIYWCVMLAYLVRSLHRGWTYGNWNPGKDLVVFSTAACWYIGIISLNSDYAFTVTNVIIHGVPYMVLIYWYRWHRDDERSRVQRDDLDDVIQRPRFELRSLGGRLSVFLGAIWVLAYAETLIWDRGLWQRHEWLFGWLVSDASASNWNLGASEAWLAGALAVPQVTHYVLDGFLWRRSDRER